MAKKKTWNQNEIKKENKQLILTTVINKSPISRAQIANHTGLNKATVSSLVSDLLNESLLFEAGLGASNGGRPPVMLYFNKIAGYAVGINLGVNFISGILTDLDGNIIIEKYISFLNLSYNKIINKIDDIIDYLISNRPISPYGIVGIGIGIPGIVTNSGIVHNAPNLEWKNKDLYTHLKNKYNIPIIIQNEANAGVYGEQKHGVGKNKKNVIYVSIGVGIGIGIIINGNLLRGNNGFLGESGHMTIDYNGLKCTCGSNGCWELYASEKYIYNNIDKYSLNIPSNTDDILSILIRLATKNEKDALEIFNVIGDNIGVGVNNIINTFDPSMIIIGNKISTAKEWIKPALFNRVKKSEWIQERNLDIKFSNLDYYSPALGMSSFVIDNFLNIKSI